MSRHITRLRQWFQTMKKLPLTLNHAPDPIETKPNAPPTGRFSGSAAGDGEGKGGGGGGAIRSAGGAFGRREAAIEEKYFHDEEINHVKEFKSKLVEIYQKQLSVLEKTKRELYEELRTASKDAKDDIEETLRKADKKMKAIQDKIKNIDKPSE